MKQDIASAIVTHRRWFAAGIFLVAVALLPFSLRSSTVLNVGGAAVNQSEAASVDQQLAEQFESPFTTSLVLVISGIPALDEVDGIDVLLDVVTQIKQQENVAGVLSYIETVDPVFLSEHGTFALVGLDPGDRRLDAIVPELREVTRSMEDHLRPDYPKIELAWTGAAAFDYDVRLTGAEDAAEAEQRVLPATLILLFIIFGSIVAAIFPLLIAGLAVSLSLGAAVLISYFWPMTALLQNIVTMIGLGIGIDYTLLILKRFREEMSVDQDPERAAARTLRTAGHTVVLSGASVAIGFSALLLVPATELRSIATGGLLVVGFSVFLSVLVLPGLLSWLGNRVEFGRLWRPAKSSRSAGRWRAWGHWVAGRPVLVLVVIGLPLLILAYQARFISTDIPSGNWLPENLESTRGAIALQGMEKSGIVQAFHVIVEFPAGTSAHSEQGWAAIIGLGKKFEQDERVARIQSLPVVLGVDTAGQAMKAIIDQELWNAFISKDGQSALIEVIPTETVSAGALMRYVRELRESNVGSDGGGAGVRVRVGGLPAHNADYQDAIGKSVISIVLLIVFGSFLALFAGFRSLLGAIKAVALNLLSVAAAMGLTVLVFQQGYGLEWLGVAQPLDGLFPAVPIIVFCVVFGLSMDYEVFLLSRVAEGVRSGMTNRDALIEGLAQTAGVITSAALIMIVVFAGFSMGDFLIVKILGFALAVAVFIDATLVRLAIGPALLQLGGRWNWWPGRGPASR